MMKRLRILATILLIIPTFACTEDAVSNDEPTELLPQPRPSNADDVPGDGTQAATGADPTPAAGNGCSIVEWCDQPGANGTVCRQVACDLPSAQQECSREATQICGSVVQPFIIICKNSSCT
jgi:hypothetical protein